jgi:SAM-dependent methyltransferase
MTRTAHASPPSAERLRRFRQAYGEHRAAEGRGAGGEAELLALPYLRRGPQAEAWAVRARSFDAFSARVVAPAARASAPRPLRIADLGAGNGWLCYRLRSTGYEAVAVDVRDDAVDGLRAADAYAAHSFAMRGRMFDRIAASFDALPLSSASFDLAVFNASLHYAFDLRATLEEAVRIVRRGGRIVILDSPFYETEAAGLAMVEEKGLAAVERFGDLADDLAALPFVEFLTAERLAAASAGDGRALSWHRHRVRYPLGYEARPLLARLRRRRAPSRFDVWEAMVP